MRPRLGTALVLFLSSYSPLMWIMCLQDVNFGVPFSYDLKTWEFNNLYFSIFLFILSIFVLAATFFILHKLEGGNKIRIESVRCKSMDIINYTVPYFISFIGFDLGFVNDILSLLIFMALLFTMYYMSGALFLNPVLLIMGYKYYEIEYSFDDKREEAILISKVLPRTKDILCAKNLSPNIYINTKKQRL